MKRNRIVAGAAAAAATALVLAGCSSGGDRPGDATGGGDGELTPVTLQLQWLTQAQFGGYYLADVERATTRTTASTSRSSPARSTSCRRTCSPQATSTSRSRGCRRRSRPSRRARTSRTSRRSSSVSGTLQVSFADSGIDGSADLVGKHVGSWGFGNEWELFAGLTEADASGYTHRAAELRHERAAHRRHRRRAGDDLQRVRAAARDRQPRDRRALPARGLLGHRLERGRHRDAPGRDLGEHRAARVRRGVRRHHGQVHQGAILGLDLRSATTRRRPPTRSPQPAPPSARATSCGWPTRSTS